ncbi:MAG: DUF59 domain-containing protein [Rhodospirillaceae bacterium]|nr:DUF59 domain-containing protein [Rhodospirillaceae bacterium]
MEVVEPDWVHVPPADGAAPDGPLDPETVKTAIVDNLLLIYDPEIPINIYDLGLIYGIEVADDGRVRLEMTLTAPNCPVAGSLPAMVERGVRKVPGVTACEVELVWDPPWNLGMASEDAQIALGYGF